MESTSDELGYFRERAAAARAKAEEAAEFPRQREAWVQVAEKWERLASRAESKPAPTAMETQRAAPISGHDDTIAPAELTRHLRGASASQLEVGGGTVRRGTVVTGFLLLSVLGVAAVWPTDKRATTVEGNPANAPARFEPQLRASSASDGPVAQAEMTTAPAEPAAVPDSAAQVMPVPERFAEAPVAPIVDVVAPAEPAPVHVAEAPGPGAPTLDFVTPAEPAPVPVAEAPAPATPLVDFVAPAEPRPERLAEVPAPAGPILDFVAPAEPAPERAAEAPAPPEIPLSETGSVEQRPEPEPDPPASEAAGAGSVSQELAAVPFPQRLSPRRPRPARDGVAPREKLTEISRAITRPKLAERKSAPRVVGATARARSALGTCTSLKKTQAGPTWTVIAECSSARASWPARIRLVLIPKRLTR